MEMSAKQPLRQSNYDAYEICVWGMQWPPPSVTCTPHHLCNTSPREILFSFPFCCFSIFICLNKLLTPFV